MPAYSFVTIDCPDTGRPITVAKNTATDPLGQLVASGWIDRLQHAAAETYQSHVEQLSGALRATSYGPRDLTWRGRRSDGNWIKKDGDRLAQAHKALGPDLTKLIRAVLIDGRPMPKNRTRDLHQALNKLAAVYGMTTRH